MAAAALAKEKVWFDKPTYDKAERLYFERMAKVGTRKILESTPLNADNSPQYLVCGNNNHHTAANNNSNSNNNPSRGKSGKCKDNKSVALNNELNEMKQSKTKSGKGSKKSEASLQKIESAEEKEKHDNVEQKEKEKETEKESKCKCTVKEAKEKKNKADTRHRNRGKVQSEAKEKTEQLTEQGNQQCTCPILPPAGGSLANEVAKARQHIKQSLQCMDDIAVLAGVSNQDVVSRVTVLEKENQDLRKVVEELKSLVYGLQERVMFLEYKNDPMKEPRLMICPQKPASPPAPAVEPPKQQEEKDDDVDLFGSDSEGEDAEAAKIREQRLAAYAAKKSKKPAVIAKSSIILDVKPWDDETDMAVMEKNVRQITTDGLLWGAAKLVPLAFGIHKLQISCVVEDDKVSIDWLTEQIQEIEDFVQSVDIAAFNKI